MPKKGQFWGSCRKFLNIFLRDVLYNHFLCKHYSLEKIEPWLEIPLDSHVASGLRQEVGGTTLPRWKTVIGLEEDQSKEFQGFARLVAVRDHNVSRIHLDLIYFRGIHTLKHRSSRC